MDAVARHSIFLGSSSISLFRRFRNQPLNQIFFEVFVIALFFAFTVKTESWFSHYVFQPLFKRLFGDNENLRRELDEQEKFLVRMLEDFKARNNNNGPLGPLDRLVETSSSDAGVSQENDSDEKR